MPSGVAFAGRAPPGKGKKASPSYHLKQLALDISDAWTRVWRYTNNAAERAIGRFLKMRSRSLRGIQVKDHIPRLAHRLAWLQEPDDEVPLAALL